MHKIEIIPAIDLIGGKCVRLSKGDYNTKKIYDARPLEVARRYQDIGIERLHLVDLDGAKGESTVNLGILEEISGRTALKIDFSGGLKSRAGILDAFNAGAAFVLIGSMAYENHTLCEAVLDEFSSEKVIIGADVRERKIAVRGWQEQTSTTLDDLIRSYGKKLRHLVCTDIARDGMFSGPSFALYQELRTTFPDLHLIASGGVSSMKDLTDLAERQIQSVIVGKALYENRITLTELANYLK